MVGSLRAWPRRAPHVLLAIWFGAMVFLSATLLARHLVALPTPPRDAAFEAAIGRLRSPGEAFAAIHVLYAECRCSRRIAQHLLSSKRPAGTSEHVVLVGAEAELERALAARGFDVRVTTADALASELHVEGAPMLIVLDGEGHVRYSGGYTTRKQGADVRDVDIIERTRNMGGAGVLEALPIFGCAVSEELRKRLDPAGVLR